MGGEVALSASLDNVDAARLYIGLGYVPTGIRDITSYEWVDTDGTERNATEEDELLLKVVRRGKDRRGD